MADDEENLTKRERQKARRAKRQEAERAAAARSRRTRLLATALVVALVVGGIGFFVQQMLASRAEEQALIEDAMARLDELGCTTDEEMPSQGAGHFGGAEVAANPPETVYEHLPTTSGRHVGNVVVTGVYEDYVDERVTTHNLEHGYVVAWYDEDADPEQVAALKAFAQERIDDGDEDLVVAPYNQALDDDANFAFVSWERRQLCESFDEGIMLNFVNEHMNDQRAPEAAAGPHRGGRQGELDPAEEPVVLPPLGDADLEAPTEDHDDEEDDGPDDEEPEPEADS